MSLVLEFSYVLCLYLCIYFVRPCLCTRILQLVDRRSFLFPVRLHVPFCSVQQYPSSARIAGRFYGVSLPFVILFRTTHLTCALSFAEHRYTIWNVVGSPPANVAVGRVKRGGFEPTEGAAKIVWPGGTIKIPSDTLRSDPKRLSIGWVMETAWGTPALQQESRMYAQQAIDEVNDNLYILPNTFLTLEGDFTVKGNDKTVDVYNAIEARAKAAGRPLAAALGGSSSHMNAIYAPQANVTVTQPNTGIPIVGYYTGAGVLSDSKKFPNFVRLYPPVSEVQHIYRKMAVSFHLFILAT